MYNKKMNTAFHPPVSFNSPRRCAVLLAAVLLTAGSVIAADALILELQSELHSLFPTALRQQASPAGLAAAPTAPFAIVSQEFLLAQTPWLHDGKGRLSLHQLRQAPPAIRTAHAACVKVITPYWHGAGVVISSEGDVLTSYHLIAGVPCASVQTMDGRIHTVTNITAASAIHDLALLRITGGPFVSLDPPANYAPAPGEPIFIVGHPGETAWKASSGTAIRRQSDRGTQVLHFEADISRGNSGGPVIDNSGRLVAITACAAELADGSKVKVGIAAPAIRAFLDAPRTPMEFADLTRIERNRRLADFLGQVCILMNVWINDWLASMALITVDSARETNGAGGIPRVRFQNTSQAATVSARLLLLRAMLLRCGGHDGIDPLLRNSLGNTAKSLDALIDGALLPGSGERSIPDSRAAITQLAQCQRDANRYFKLALESVQSASTRFELDVADPLQFQRLSALRSQASVGCKAQP